MPMSREEAREIAQGFLAVAHALGTYRFGHWTRLTPAQRREIEGAEWHLINYSSDFPTTAVGTRLCDRHTDLMRIRTVVARATRMVGTLSPKQVLMVAPALVSLGNAIASQEPEVIAAAAVEAIRTVQDVTRPERVPAGRRRRAQVIPITALRDRLARTGRSA